MRDRWRSLVAWTSESGGSGDVDADVDVDVVGAACDCGGCDWDGACVDCCVDGAVPRS